MTVASYADEGVAIYAWLTSHWAETPVAKPNTQFTPPDRAPYVETRIRTQSAFNASINASSKLVRHPGLLTLVVRSPTNLGDGAAIDHADELAGVFRNATVDGSIHFRAPTVRALGPTDGWYEVHVDCPYYRDTVFTD